MAVILQIQSSQTYRNLHKIQADFIGGYTTCAGVHRDRNNGEIFPPHIGEEYKE
jgi:hypothetical protein